MVRTFLAPQSGFAYHQLDPRQARGRLLLSMLAATVVMFSLGREFGWVLRSLGAFDAGVATLLILDSIAILGSTEEATRHRAAAQDPGRNFIWIIVLAGSTVGFFSAAFVLRHTHDFAKEVHTWACTLSLAAVVGAWLVVNASFALRYAHLYFRDDGSGEGGLLFPGDETPDALDFAYFAFTIGMCFQVSDVCIVRRVIRRAVLLHSMLSFAYNTIILGMVLNLFFGMLG